PVTTATRRAGTGSRIRPAARRQRAHPAPRLAPGIVRRPALVERLTTAADAPLALLVAPPGFGKSTLLAEWAECDRRPFLWLGRGDVRPGVRRLIRAAYAEQDHGVVVVLDGAEHVEPAALDEILDVAVGEGSPGLTVALASRTEPRLPLGRLRAHRLLVEVRAPDLRMSVAQATLMLAGQGFDLDPATVQALVARTQGWPAALYLAALALRDAPGELEALGGRHHLLAAYIRDDVLSALPQELLRFARRTSLLHDLSSAACDAILGEPGSGAVLAELARVSPLLAPVDAAHDHFRWHPLVADALRAELSRSEPESEPELRRRASRWYAGSGDVKRALDHASAAGDAEQTVRLLSRHILSFLTCGHNDYVSDWLSTLGSDRVADHPPLALAASLSGLVAGRLSEAKRWSAAASRPMNDAADPVATGLDLVSMLAASRRISELGQVAAVAATDPRTGRWRSFCLLLEGVSLHLTGERSRAAEILDEAVPAIAGEAPAVAALCLAQRAMIAIEVSDWDLAADLTDEARRTVGEWKLEREPVMALVFAAAAAARAHHGRSDEAKADLRAGIDLLAALGDYLPWYGAEIRILLGHASLWLVDVVRARTLLAEASRLARRTPDAVIFAQWFDEAWAHLDTLAETSLAGPSSLTIAELRILRFLPSHRSFREIAAQLNVSANTVKTQAHAIYRKLGAASRSEAVARATEAGLLGQ
ncbi:MAG TPA: LuxR C-terminal-related transcriptional regulator, partial [Solirubrobacteraceae bacterium]|nr:LuxR C-terminal-related transcriptional regulator [Solirubrobacteraceae bacterium]